MSSKLTPASSVSAHARNAENQLAIAVRTRIDRFLKSRKNRTAQAREILLWTTEFAKLVALEVGKPLPDLQPPPPVPPLASRADRVQPTIPAKMVPIVTEEEKILHGRVIEIVDTWNVTGGVMTDFLRETFPRNTLFNALNELQHRTSGREGWAWQVVNDACAI